MKDDKINVAVGFKNGHLGKVIFDGETYENFEQSPLSFVKDYEDLLAETIKKITKAYEKNPNLFKEHPEGFSIFNQDEIPK